MNFEAYLTSKKIDAAIFCKAEPDIYKNLEIIFQQVHPNSFEMQKKFLINDLRRKYLLKA